MSGKVLISVVIPLYNKAPWVKRCIDSIVSQSYQELEILVVNDGSTDNSVEVVKKIEDSRIRVIDKPNGGVSSARNRGIDEAKGEFIAFLDADDMWMPRHIEALLKGFQDHSNASIISNRLNDRMNGQGTQNENAHDEPFKFIQFDYLFELSENRFPIHIGSSMYRKSTIDTHTIKFYEHVHLGEDVNFMIRVSRFGPCLLSNYTGMVYFHDDDASAMHKKSNNVILTPLFFEGLSQEVWSQKECGHIQKFLRREYKKKAYQNRGLSFQKEELNTSVGGGFEIGRWMLPIYLLIRFIPSFIFVMMKKVRETHG